MFLAEDLLAPISAAAPSGHDLAFSSELDAISLARTFDDPSLDQGEWVTDLKEADWEFVATRCAALLAQQTKDLRLAVWLTEAGAKHDHLRGLGEGLRVLAGLCERYWDDGLYPLSDDGDHDQRIGNLSWILGRCPTLLRDMPLTEGRGSAYSTLDFDTARRQASKAQGSGQPAGDGIKLADMEAARARNSASFNAALVADAEFCLDALAQLERAADARLGMDSPGFSGARDALQTLLRGLPAVAVATVDDGAPLAATAVADGAAPAALAAPAVPGTLQNRAQALAQLRLVAAFFRRTEPHSPVSYFADKAADAGEQNLHDWLRSVVKDGASLAHIEELLGVKSATE